MENAQGIWLDSANYFLGILIEIAFIDSLFGFWVHNTVKYLQEEKTSRALYLSFIALVYLFSIRNTK